MKNYTVKMIHPHEMEDGVLYKGISFEKAEHVYKEAILRENFQIRIVSMEVEEYGNTEVIYANVDFKRPEGAYLFLHNNEVDPALKRFYNFLVKYTLQVEPIPW